MTYDIYTTTCGHQIEIGSDMAGMKTGFGKIVNGYMAGIEHFDRYSDGDTVVGCEAGDVGAMPVADAYYELRKRFEEDDQW